MSFIKLSPEQWDIARTIWKQNKHRNLTTDQWYPLLQRAGLLDATVWQAAMDAVRGIMQKLGHEAQREGRPGEAIGNIRVQDKQGEWKWTYKEWDDMSESQLKMFNNSEYAKIGAQRRKTARIYQFGVNKFGESYKQGLMFRAEDLPETNDDLDDEDEPEV